MLPHPRVCRCALFAALCTMLLTVAAPAQEGDKKGGTPGIQDLENLLKKLPPGIADRLKNLPVDPQELMKRLQAFDPQNLQELRKLMEQFGGGRLQRLGNRGVTEGRLGVELQTPAPVLVDQLGLAEGKGLVINSVQEDSAASKAGLKSNDILLKLAGKDVPADIAEFRTLIKDVKANEAVDAVVLRKGKEETVRGVSLPEAGPESKLPDLRKRLEERLKKKIDDE